MTPPDIFIRPGSKLRMTVPVPGGRDLERGLRRAVMELAEMAEAEP